MSKEDEALDKMAENARQVGLDYEPGSVSKLAREAGIRDCTCNGTKGCLERFAELVRADERNRTWTQEHWTEYERSIAAVEQQRIVNLLMIQHEAAKRAHNYWHVAAQLIQADVASNT